MTRTKFTNKDVHAILISDVHLREDVPICRTDDFFSAMWNKMDFISDLQKQYECPVLCGGDVFDYWKPSPALLSETSKHIPDQFYSVYGQHDLPQHNMELAFKSGLFNLITNNKVTLLPECSWGQKPKYGSSTLYDLLVWHVTTYQEKENWMDTVGAMSARAILKKYPQFKLILTGDNHKPFVEEYQGRLLVNPGSMLRTSASQVDHKPRIYLWHAIDNTVTAVYLPIQTGIISREHIDLKDQRDERIDAFVSRLDDTWKASLSFEQNLELFKAQNKIRTSVMDIVYKSIEK